jgi:predicted dithiol-disulfide oxidoreductase (DUF899 family)
MNNPEIVSYESWTAARAELLTLEKEHTRRGDQLARLRHELPWVRIDKRYTFGTDKGPRTLTELFGGRSQLVIYHFMFGPDYEAGCPVCSSIADGFNGILEHLKARDVTMICMSRAPLEKLLAYRARMGWNFDWASSNGSEFNFDFGRSVTKDTVATWFPNEPPAIPARLAADCGTDAIGYLSEGPGLSVFTRSGPDVCLTYSTTARGLEPVMVYYGILDRVPRGRNEGQPADPSWIRRHDEFAGPARE